MKKDTELCRESAELSDEREEKRMTQTTELTADILQAFFLFLEAKKRSGGTRELYERAVKMLLDFLPDGRTLDRELLERWKQQMIDAGYALRTVNSRISALNSLMKFMGRRDLQLSHLTLPENEVQPELTRREYLRLLNAAKLKGNERTYFIIKTICCGGIHVQEIPEITVEVVKTDLLPGRRPEKQKLYLPSVLKRDLLDYAARQGIQSGHLFVTKYGTPVSRTNVNNSIRRLCRDAQIDAEKCNSQCLLKLRKRTYEEIENSISLLVQQAHDRILEQEEIAAGWE